MFAYISSRGKCQTIYTTALENIKMRRQRPVYSVVSAIGENVWERGVQLFVSDWGGFSKFCYRVEKILTLVPQSKNLMGRDVFSVNHPAAF